MTLLRHLPRFREAYRSLEESASREQWSRSEIECLQLERLNAVWGHAIAHVPYYRQLCADADLPPIFASLDEFREAVPVLSRDLVRAAPRQLLSDRALPGRWRVSGGSTGMPTAFFWSLEAHCATLRAKYRFHAMWNVDIFDRLAFLWGHAASFAPGLPGTLARWSRPVTDRLRNRLRLSAYRLGPDELQQHLRRMERYEPACLYGYSTAVYLLAEEAMRCGIVPQSLRAVILTAEPARDFMCDATRRAFDVPALVEYGASEFGFIAGQWPDGTLRVRDDIVMAETLPRDDGHFDIVLTGLVNSSFPLLRYAIADVTDAPLKTPECGFAFLENIMGRQADLVRSRSGDRIHPSLLMNIIELGPGTRRYQVRQYSDGAILVRIEPSSAETRVDVARIAKTVGDAVEGYPVSVEIVDALEANLAGKHRWIISDMADETTASGNHRTASIQ